MNINLSSGDVGLLYENVEIDFSTTFSKKYVGLVLLSIFNLDTNN